MRRTTTKIVRVQLVDADQQDFAYERPAVTNAKLALLIFFTFGLIVAMFALTTAIETMQGSKANSYMAGGGVILGLFICYLIFFGVKWYCGSGQREALRREAVEKQIAKERALEALRNVE